MDHRRKTKAQLIDEITTLTRRIEQMEEAVSSSGARFRGTHAEEALRGNEQRELERADELSALLDAVPIPVFIAHDPACFHITGNHAADALLRSPHGSEASLGASPDTRPRHFKAFKDGQELRVDELPAQRAARGEHVKDFEFSIVFEDGEVRHVVGNGTPMLDARGQPRGSILALIDITDRKRVEELVREREKDLRLVMDTVPALISYVDRDFRYVRVNNAYERWFGLAPGDIEGRHLRDVLGEAAWEKIRSHVEGAMSGEIVTYEEEMPFRTGGTRWIFATLVPNRDDSGAVPGIVALVTDITERKRTEEALRESEARLRMHIERMPIGCIAHDENNCFSQLNPAAEHIFGYSEEELKGKHADLLVPVAARPHVDSILCRLAEGDMAAHSVNENVTKDGRTIVCEWTNTPLRNPSGTFAGILSMVQDVTERNRAEEALRESEERFRAVFESSSDCILVWDRQYNYLYANQAAIDHVGTTRDKVIGKNMREGLSHAPDFMHLWMGRVDRAFATGESFRVEDAVTVGGRLVYSESQVSPIRNAAGEVFAVGVVYRDVTERERVEEALRESESFYRQTLESIPGMVFTTRPDGYCDYQSQQWVDYTGVPMSEHLGDGWNKLLHPDDRPRAFAAWRAAVEERALYDLEYRVRRRDGQYEWFKVRGTPIRDAAGRIVRWFGVATNINELKQAEAAVIEREERLSTLYAAMAEGLVSHEIVYADGIAVDYIITDVNPAFEKITGIIRESAIGRRATELYRTEEAPYLDVYARVARGGAAETFETYFAPMEKYFAISVFSPGKGKFATVFSDITGRKRAEEALKALHADLERKVEQRTEELANVNKALERENAERRRAEDAQRLLADAFQDLYNKAPCGYHSLDADGVFVRINDTELKWLGYQRNEVIGKIRFSDLLTPESKETFRDTFLLFKERGEVRDLEYKVLRKDGTVLPVLLSATAVRDDKGEFLMSRSTIFDLSERKKAEAEVLRAAKLSTLGELAATVAHEINNPINSIVNYAQILKDLGDRQHKEHDFVGEILHEGNRIAGIVRNLLSYAREGKPDKRRIAVEDIISNSAALCTAALRKEGIELRVGMEKDLPPVMGNPQQLQQVMMNLISNARHALRERPRGSHPGRVLEIRGEEVTEEGRALTRISVRDNGTGIPASLLERVTEPFFTTKPLGLGTGLGLSISRKIIEEHQGRLAVESVEGQYTKVLIELPAAAWSGAERDR